ncbi:16335_t:CDS:1, partial [Dentiscutata heterogama]
ISFGNNTFENNIYKDNIYKDDTYKNNIYKDNIFQNIEADTIAKFSSFQDIKIDFKDINSIENIDDQPSFKKTKRLLST